MIKFFMKEIEPRQYRDDDGNIAFKKREVEFFEQKIPDERDGRNKDREEKKFQVINGRVDKTIIEQYPKEYAAFKESLKKPAKEPKNNEPPKDKEPDKEGGPK